MPLGANAIVLVTYASTYSGQRILLTSTWRVGATNSTQTPALDTLDIATYFGTGGANTLLTKYLACLSQNVTVGSCIAQGIHPTRFVKASVTVAQGGTVAADAPSGNTCGVVTLRTALAGRKQIANKHIGPIAGSSAAFGSPVTALRTALQDVGIQLITSRTVNCTTAGQTIPLEPVIFHRGDKTSTGLESYVVSDRIGTLRRRTLRVGE